MGRKNPPLKGKPSSQRHNYIALKNTKTKATSSFPSHTVEERKSDQTSAATKNGGTPERIQKEQSHFSGLSLVFISVLFAALILACREWFSTRNDLTFSEGRSRSLETELQTTKLDLKIALAQHEILTLLGPHIFSLSNLSLSEKGSQTEFSLGRCPNLPCYKIQYKGIEKDQQEQHSRMAWEVSGENESQVQLNNITFRIPIQDKCFGKLEVTKDHAIVFFLRRIISREEFDVTLALIKADPQEPMHSVFGAFRQRTDCIK